MTLNHTYLFNYKIINDSIENILIDIDKHINFGDYPKSLACINPHSLIISERDNEFREALSTADYLLPDGIGIVFASRLILKKKIIRITGPDIFQTLMFNLNTNNGKKIFFLGSDNNTLNQVAFQMIRKYPNIILSGTYSPPYKEHFSEEDNNTMIKLINQHKPDVLWVGLTAPKQEKWVYTNSHLLNVKFIASVGAVFDYFAGTVKPPPKWVSTYGLQWIHRFFCNPRKIWKRIFISGPLFILLTFKNILFRKKSNS